MARVVPHRSDQFVTSFGDRRRVGGVDRWPVCHTCASTQRAITGPVGPAAGPDAGVTVGVAAEMFRLFAPESAVSRGRLAVCPHRRTEARYAQALAERTGRLREASGVARL
ncbi:hypothetical protein GCM10009030_23900 [Haloarcula pellucida]|uniref:Uncharacterized protein n=1 Tax=Haloarcula pellucida TaxID=1427151 RepID=A0A830GN18_9EURY|nr:hypothetical protein GCM10009030_23900 [Halomicroarcula pellucida]